MISDTEAKVILSATSFFVGAIVWSLKGWISEKLIKRRASDQLISLGELDIYCRRKHDSDALFREAEIKHLKELLGKDLGFNASKLKSLEASVSILNGLLGDINKEILLGIKKGG